VLIPNAAPMREVDKYGIPLDEFGEGILPELFEILGRILTVNAKIEYFKDRLDHLPSPETSGVRKVEQFNQRYESGRLERNAVVHSFWVFGAHKEDPDVVTGIRYKKNKKSFGEAATLSILDVPDSESDQLIVQYKLDALRTLLRGYITTMQIGDRALSEVLLNWAAAQVLAEQGGLASNASLKSTNEVERQMALFEKSQQLAGHFPDADALGRARRILTGETTSAEAYAELDAKFPRA
jgi:hypothetical protein